MTTERRRVPFPYKHGAKAFNEQFRTLVAESFRHEVDNVIPPENSHALYHGRNWTEERPDGSEMESKIEEHTTETTLKFDDIIQCRFSVLADQILSIVSQMRDEFMKSLYSRISEGVEQVGNVVDARGMNPADAILAMLRKIEFGVNREGQVSRPEIHLHPDAVEKITEALDNAGPEFKAEVDRVTAEKEAEALKREAARVARFRVRPEGQ
jgi:hypothetical protein